MIAFARPAKTKTQASSAPKWHEEFLEMLPAIRRHARRSFIDLTPQARAEAVDEVVANALVAFARLVELGKRDLAYPTPLARYAIQQVRSGRQVGARLNVHDVTSRYAQQRQGLRLERLDSYGEGAHDWREMLVEDKRATPADMAASRIDFAAWLGTLSTRRRRIATILATGETTGATARQFGVTQARISQLRRELRDAWRRFQGEPPPAADSGRTGTALCCTSTTICTPRARAGGN